MASNDNLVAAGEEEILYIISNIFAKPQEVNMLGEEETLSDNKNCAISDFPLPSAREYILRTVAPRPAPYSKSLPQKMYCSILGGHVFKLAGAFTSDSLFQ